MVFLYTVISRAVSANSRLLPSLKRAHKPVTVSHRSVHVGRLRRCLSSTSVWPFRKHCSTSTVVSLTLQVFGTPPLSVDGIPKM
jgi:hypothetical protein